MKNGILLVTLLFITASSYAQENTELTNSKPDRFSAYGSLVGGLYNGYTFNFEAPLIHSKNGSRQLRVRTGVGGINQWGADRGRSTVKGAALGLTILFGGTHHFFEFSPTLFAGKTAKISPHIFGYPQIEIAYRYVHSTGLTTRFQIGIPYVGISFGSSF